MRANDPVYRHATPDGGHFFAVTRFDDVRSVGRDADAFSSEPTIMLDDPDPGTDMGEHKMMLMADPPMHTRMRRMVSRDFTPGAARRLRPRIEELAVRIVDEVVERGECDLVADIAGEMPSFVIADLLGIPLEADDLASLLATGELEGQPLDEIDFFLWFLLLVDAGGDTTRNLVGGGVHALFEHPDQLAVLRADVDEVLPSAIEELLRYVSPVVHMRRRATSDTELRGVAIAEGDRVVTYYGAANRDPAAFARPHELDLRRSPNHHVSFGGGGPHFCMGAHIARIEVDALIRQVLARLDDLAPAGEAQWLASNFICGPTRLPVTFRPGPRLGRFTTP